MLSAIIQINHNLHPVLQPLDSQPDLTKVPGSGTSSVGTRWCYSAGGHLCSLRLLVEEKLLLQAEQLNGFCPV